MNKKVGIVVPCYNASEYLEECLESIKNQLYRNFICVIVNDGSTDSSDRIINKYCETDSAMFRSIFQENSGLSAARNAGVDFLKKSSGGGRIYNFC